MGKKDEVKTAIFPFQNYRNIRNLLIEWNDRERWATCRVFLRVARKDKGVSLLRIVTSRPQNVLSLRRPLKHLSPTFFCPSSPASLPCKCFFVVRSFKNGEEINSKSFLSSSLSFFFHPCRPDHFFPFPATRSKRENASCRTVKAYLCERLWNMASRGIQYRRCIIK